MASDRADSGQWAELRDMFDAAPALVWATDLAGSGQLFSAGWGRFTGLAADDLRGYGWLEAVHAEDREALLRPPEAGETGRREFRMRRADGAWRWMRDTVGPRLGAGGAPLGHVHVATDVTDARGARSAAERDAARLQLAEEATGVGTYDWDLETGRVVLSPGLFRIYRIPPDTPPEAILGQWRGRVHPDDRERVESELDRFIREGGTTASEFRVRLPDGELRWMEARGRVLRDEGGRRRMIGVNFDVTERRRSEAALREGEARLRGIAENFPGIIFQRVTHPDGRVEYPFASGKGAGSFGHISERVGGSSSVEELAALVHYEDVDEMLARFREAAETFSPLELEGRIVEGGNTLGWVRSVSRPRPREDGALVWDGYMLDVTEHRARESERERAAMTLRLAMEVAGIGTWELDPGSGLVVASSVTNAVFGLPADEVARPIELYLERIHPEDVQLFLLRLEEARAGGGAVVFEYRVETAEGRRWIASRGARVRMSDGTVRVIGALSDATDRRRREEEREGALRRQRGLLRELNHRIKNNLQMITSVLRLQARLEGGGYSPDFLRAIERVQTISDLHAHLGADGDLGPIDFGGYLADYCQTLRALADPKGITVECDLRPCPLDMDRAVPLGIIANELATNALTHGFPAGGGGRVWFKLAEAGGELRLEIGHDGIAAANGPRSGLGLQLVEGLCRQVGARHVLKNGAVNLVTLPLERP